MGTGHRTYVLSSVLSLSLALLVPRLQPSLAAEDWQPIGPAGSIPQHIVVDPSSSTVFVATESGTLLRSRDDGLTWDLIEESLRRPVFRIRDLEVGLEGALYVLPEVGEPRRSDDGDHFETLASLEIPSRQGATFALALITDPVDSRVVYAVSFEGLHRSTDRGRHWSYLGQPQSPSEAPRLEPRFRVSGLLIEPHSSSDLWAFDGKRVLHSEDRGRSWEERSSGLNDSVHTLLALPLEPLVLLAGTSQGLYQSRDRGASWSRSNITLPITELFADPADPHHAFALILGGSLYETHDGGLSWQPASRSLPRGGISAVAAAGGRTVFVASKEGLYRSTDDGLSWQAEAPLPGLRVHSLSAHPAHVGELLVATPRGIHYRSAENAVWQLTLQGHGVAVDRLGNAPETVFAWLDDRVWRSLDGGLTWQGVFSPGSESYTSGLWVDRGVGRRVVRAQTFDPGFGGHFRSLWQSTDLGETWEPFYDRTLPGAPGPVLDVAVDPFDSAGALVSVAPGRIVQFREGEAPTLSFVATEAADAFIHIAADPLSPGRFLAAVPQVGLFGTVDGGRHWQPAGTGLPSSFVPVVDPNIEFHPTLEGLVAAITDVGVFTSADAGAGWSSLGEAPAGGANSLSVSGDAVYVGTEDGVYQHAAESLPCVDTPTTLCLAGGRFEARVEWQDFSSGQGAGHSHPLTGDTGAFWFFDPDNLELAVKMIDGRALNDHWWFFYGSLSSVGFRLVVRDTVTGERRVYNNERGRLASFGDTGAFPALKSPRGLLGTFESSPPAANGKGGETATALRLGQGRFEVKVRWQDFQGGKGSGTGVPLTDDTGAFWFFDPENLELFVKLLDGRPVNGHWWLLYGSLTNVELELEVTDLDSGQTRAYSNAAGTFASGADTGSF